MDQEYFFNLDIDENENSICRQSKIAKDKVDEFVELACYPNSNNIDWSLIKRELKDIYCIDDLVEAMVKYNPSLRDKNFDNLYLLCKDGLTKDECNDFFQKLLPKIINLALQLPDLINQPIPYLKREKNMKLHFSQQQVACILANAFLCTFPTKSDNFKLPEINFNPLFTTATQRNPVKVEKLKCFLNYFRRLTDEQHAPNGVLTFERRCIDEKRFPDWPNSNKSICKLQVLKDTTIEKEEGIRIDFANKKIGGGVLRTGAVQEEIQFLMNPELVCARLFSESMLTNEALIIYGSEKFNESTGYADSFKWASDYHDQTELDSQSRRKNLIIGIDAVNYSGKVLEQYEEKFIRRDCNKAFCAFITEHELNSLSEYSETDFLKIVTGNWGCGAFKGDRSFKSVLQLIVSSETNRDMVYVSFEDDGFKDELVKFYDYLISKKYNVGQVYKLLGKYGEFKSKNSEKSFFDFVYETT